MEDLAADLKQVDAISKTVTKLLIFRILLDVYIACYLFVAPANVLGIRIVAIVSVAIIGRCKYVVQQPLAIGQSIVE